MSIEHQRNWRATAEAYQMQRDEALTECERLRAEWRKADDGWIACQEQLRVAVEALRVTDDLLRRFSISANDHSELIRLEFGKAQRQINDARGVGNTANNDGS